MRVYTVVGFTNTVGIPLGNGVTVPLDYNVLIPLCINNASIFSRTKANLDSQGRNTATIHTPVFPAVVGARVLVACVIQDLKTGRFVQVSEPHSYVYYTR